jgi:uncharacterized membrane protein
VSEFSKDETAEARAFDYARTVALSDGVFAIAMTLLVLNLTIPELASGHHGELGNALWGRRTEFYCYALSFAVISLHWVRHHTLFRAVTRIDTRLTWMNLTYLGFIAFLPYPTGVLGTYGSEAASVVLYATIGAILAILGALVRRHVVRAHLVPDVAASVIAEREHWAIVPGIFLTSIPIAFVSPTAAELWWLLFLLPGARRRSSS